MKSLLTPSEYTLPNPRIDGWKKFQEVGARIVDIAVFPLEVFTYFKREKSLPVDFEKELSSKAEKMIAASPSHTVLVRRAFVVPGLENPPGPRFLGLKTAQNVIDSVKELYTFAIKQGYDKDSKSQISGWLEPPSTVLDLEKYQTNPSSVPIPYGGYAISENGTIEIFAVFGINEGVQSLVADRYILECRHGRYYVLRKEIPQKNLMLCTTSQSQSQLLPVPVDLQFDQVLSDGEIPEVARVVYELSQKYGPQRIEFSTDEQGICFNEVADYYRKEAMEESKVKVSGQVMSIKSPEDLTKLSTIESARLESGEIIVLVGEDVITNRNYDVLGALAAWKDKLFVLYPGVAATQHAMRILADKGHRAFLVGTQKFGEGDKVQITTVGGKIRVTNLSRAENQKVVSLWDASLLGTDLCGGKAQRLSELKVFGFQVPHGSVCTTIVFDEILQELGIRKLSLEDFPELENKLVKGNSKITDIIDSLLPDYRESKRSFAVRSSATAEDSHRYSLAGVFESYLNVLPEDLTDRIIAVLRSTFTKRALENLRHHPELVETLKMAVVVQEMVPAKFAGVIFGAKVQTGDPNIVELEVNKGLGEDLVSGNAETVEAYSFNRQERRVIERKGPTYLTQSEARSLFMLSDRLREEFSDVPQDIEWAIDHGDQIWVIQSRDLYLGDNV